MRIHQSLPSPVSTSPCSSSSSSSCFSTSSSSIHSTISSHSLTSSSNSSSSSTSSFSPSPSRRCEGLDLLVKAVYHVAGSVIGVPYIQRRIIRRRKPAARFMNALSNHHDGIDQFHNSKISIANHHEDGDGDIEVDCGQLNKLVVVGKTKKQNKGKSKAAVAKYQDSVLQALKPKDRRKRRSSKA